MICLHNAAQPNDSHTGPTAGVGAEDQGVVLQITATHIQTQLHLETQLSVSLQGLLRQVVFSSVGFCRARRM